MKILAWNCRGLASARAVRVLMAIQKRERPDVFFLSETHLGKAKADKLRRKLFCDITSLLRVMAAVEVYYCFGERIFQLQCKSCQIILLTCWLMMADSGGSLEFMVNHGGRRRRKHGRR